MSGVGWGRSVLVSMLVAPTMALAGCGDDGTGGSTASSVASTADTDKPKIKVVIAAPQADATIRDDRVVVRGTVVPPDAAVQITGLTAAVESGVFHRSVPIKSGPNSLDVVATKDGMDPVTKSVSITRGRSEQQIAKARAASEKRAA